MVLVIGSHSFVLNLAVDPSCAEHRRVANAGELKDLGRVQSASANYDFPLRVYRVRLAPIGELHTSSFITIQLNGRDSLSLIHI